MGEPADDDLFLLIFTSGSTGLPKAVRCTQGRIGRTGAHVAGIAELTDRRRRLRAAAVLPRRLAVHRVVGGRPRRHPDLDPGPVLGVGHRARHPRLRRHLPHLHRQGPQLHPERARGTRRRDRPAPAGHRQRGLRARHPRLRPPLRLPRPRQLRLDRGRDHHPPRPVDARGRPRHRGRLGQGARPRHRRRVPPRRVRRRPAGSPTSTTRSARSSRPRRRRASRATTATRPPPRSASATAPTGRATSPTATPTGGCSSPAGRTTGCASTARTSRPARSRRSSPATPTCARSPSTPCPTTRSATG